MAFINRQKIVVDPIPLTKEELDKKKRLQKTLLKTQEEVLKRLQIAREMGDLSENGAYHAAKHELGSVRRQLRNVNHILKYAYVPEIISSNVVMFGSQVTLENNGKKLEFTLVSQYESNPLEKKLSMESPIGKAVLNKQVGDRVKVITPNGEVEYTVISIN